MLSVILFCALLILGGLFLWPLKAKIYKKKGKIISNDEILKLAREGDEDAKELRKRTKRFFWAGAVWGVIFLLEKYRIINLIA